jgi:hypothetical protein
VILAELAGRFQQLMVRSHFRVTFAMRCAQRAAHKVKQSQVFPALSRPHYDQRGNRQRPHALRVAQLKERGIPMKNSIQSLALAAAVAGLMGGTSVRLNAQTTQADGAPTSAHAGVMLAQDTPVAKHSCKGKNDCKGQGGGKNAGKNDCKGKGGCATDGSKPPKKA